MDEVDNEKAKHAASGPRGHGELTLGTQPYEGIEIRSVAAILFTDDGHYLMQLRDGAPEIFMPRCWGLFGGRIEAGESAEAALLRELNEELDFVPRCCSPFTELVYSRSMWERGWAWKAFFEVPVSRGEVVAMNQREGAAMRLMTAGEICSQRRIVPWDVYGVMLHARRDVLVPR